MLYVNEPFAPGRTVVGVATGASGTLTVAYPSNFCGVLQADALIGPVPWKMVTGHRTTIQTVQPCPPDSTTAAPPQTQATSALPFSGSSTTSTVAAVTAATSSSGNGKSGDAAAIAQLPFTGVDLTPLALLGIALILIGLLVLTTVEQRRRALRRAAITVRSGPVGDYSARTSRWFLGE